MGGAGVLSMRRTRERWRRESATELRENHVKRQHQEIQLPKKVPNIVQLLNFQLKNLRENESPAKFAQSSKIYQKFQCDGCDGLFRDPTHIGRHYSSKNNSCSSNDGFRRTKCYLSTCGRFYPIREPMEGTNLPSPGGAGGEDNTDPSRQPQPLPNSNPALGFMQYFGSGLPSNNLVGPAEVEAILTQLIDEGDITKYWLKLFHKQIATSDEHFIEKKRQELEEDHLKPRLVLGSPGPLQRLMDLFIDLEGHVKPIADGIPANFKSQLVKFELTKEGDDELEGANTWAFRYRDNSSPQLREFGHLLCFLHYHKCPILQEYIDGVSAGSYDQRASFQSGVLPKLIYELTVDSVPDGDYIPWICRFALWRCLMLKDGAPRMKSSNVCGKQLATTLYLLREGVLACASMMIHGGHELRASEMIAAAQEGHVINMISPWISNCRAMTNMQAQKETSKQAANEDFVCNNATFRQCIYKQLIPLVRSTIVRLFGQIFLTDVWKLFLSQNAQLVVGDRWFFGDVAVCQNGNSGAKVQLRSLLLKEGYHLRHPLFQQLASEFEICFHGFGGGSERQTTVLGLFAKQLKITNNLDLFYVAVHGKQANVRSKGKVPVEHQLPRSLLPLYLLFRQITMELETEPSNLAIPPIPSRTFTMKIRP
ncbi:hypothetical protein ACHAXT_003796 [Thalassiosira profunda]